MNVGELITELQAYDPNRPVFMVVPVKSGSCWRQHVVLGTFRSDPGIAVNIHSDAQTQKEASE